MTESEWLAATDPQPMLEYLRGKVSDRKLRLFACACCRRIWPLFLGVSRSREAVVVSERFADGSATRAELKAVRKRSRGCEVATTRLDAYEAALETPGAASYAVRLLAIDCTDGDPILAGYTTHTPAADRLAEEQTIGQCNLLRDIFGNPLSPSTSLPPAILTWNDGTVKRLAQAIYDDRRLPEGTLDTSRLAILADALLDAGCEAEELLSHLRSDGPHWRGCWGVDLLLGRS